ncbi:MAG TPA: RNA polymerase sigma-70 factor [Egibacteraceae bacterium]
MSTADQQFAEHRPLLLGLAYRLLGSMWDAEDVVQDAWLRWTRSDHAQVREPRAYLITTVTRLALDVLRSARVTREAYPGPWLPEPVRTDQPGPLDTTELRDSVSIATLHLMERLTPPQRAVFVLREAFALPYDEIAEIVGTTAANCRQLHSRASRLLAERGPRFAPSPAAHRELVERFLDAAGSGDLDALAELLSDDVVSWNDGGGKVRASRRPIAGRRNVVAFIAGLLRQYPVEAVVPLEANGEPAVWMVIGGEEQLVTFGVRDGRIDAIYGIRNPDKLRYARPTVAG